MKFTLDFKSDNYGKKIIDEPFGLSNISFSLKQKEMGLARDISLTGGEAQFEFTNMRNHELKQLLYYRRKFGFESKVDLIIEIDNDNSFICELDFADSETDDFKYLKCKGIQQGKFQVLKRRLETIVDVKSDVDIDGNYIGGLIPKNMLLLAKPIIQTSEWSEIPFNNPIGADGYLNPCINIVKSNIEDTTTPFQKRIPYGTGTPIEDFQLIKAANNLTNLVINLKGIIFSITDATANNDVKIILNVGAERKVIDSRIGVLIDIKEDYIIEVPSLKRGEIISFYIEWNASRISGPGPVVVNAVVNVKSIIIAAESLAYNSVSPSFRLIDVMRQVIKSVSGLEVNAPRFDIGGQFYDNRLLDGNFLRNITNKNFSVSLDDIEKSITEFRGDWEIGSDGKIFFGIEQDFYTNIEIGFFNNIQFSSMNKTFNPKYKVNEFGFKYKNYQSLKENEELNSADTIHGESKFSFFNKLVENKKEVTVEWTRDAFLIEETRRNALIIKENTASQNDDTLFNIDSINTPADVTFIEVANFSHAYNIDTTRLTLTNDGTLDFLSLGIKVGSTFIIGGTDPNQGTYIVYSVLNNIIELNGVGSSSSGNGIRPTKFTYTLDVNSIPFTNYTNLGFSETSNLGTADNYSNRRYSIMRNIYNYWQSYLATCNIYWKNNVLKNTWYKNNGAYTAKYDGVKLTEKADFLPINPILSADLYNDIIFKNVEFEDFITLQNNVRSQRGYIRAIDNNDQVIKIYPINMDYKLLEKELIIKAEGKYEPTNMTIVIDPNFVLINNNTRVQTVYWKIDNEKLYLFDENRYRLYNGVYWMEVSVNGAIPISIIQLKEWIGLIKNSVEIS